MKTKLTDEQWLEHSEERSVIGGMLIAEGNYPAVVRLLEPEHFKLVNHRAHWTAIKDLLADGVPVDECTVNRRLKEVGWGDDFEYLNRLATETPWGNSLGHWASYVLKDGQKKVAQRSLQDALGLAGDMDDPAEIAALFRNTVNEIKVQDPTKGLRHVTEPLKVLIDESMGGEPSRAVIAKTGIKEVDRQFHMHTGALTIIAGRPSMGKSALAGNIVAYCARGEGDVALFSLEMDAVAVMKRIICGKMGYPEDLADKWQDYKSMNLWIDDDPGLSVEQIRQALASRALRPKLIVVDYLQLMKLDTTLERHDLRVGKITKDLKIMAKEFDCHVIALSQLNRKVEDSKPPIPNMSHLRDSGQLEEDADNVLLLYRANYYDKTEPEYEALIIIGKQRHGTTGGVLVRWDGGRTSFGDL